MVGVAHRQCRRDEWKGEHQWRLSFSRAEIVLLNSWMPVQQIVYHVLRVFIKTEVPADSVANPGVRNYHIKTLMLWACELESTSWWTDDVNLIRICVELLHSLAVWLSGDARCQHYFINNCNLFNEFENMHCTQVTANRLMSITRVWFCEWLIGNYVGKCTQVCTGVSSLLQDTFSLMPYGLHDVVCLQNVVSEIVTWRLDTSLKLSFIHTAVLQLTMIALVSSFSPTLQLCLCWMYLLAKTDQTLLVYFTAVVFLRVARVTTSQGSLTDEVLDVLATACLQSNNARRCLSARHSSVLSLSQAAILMKVVANNSHSTVQLIEIELAKAYLHRALRCKDSNSNSICCLANVYLAVLYYKTLHYQTAMDHSSLVTRLHNHCQCSSYVVQGELLPRIDDQVDNILGLTVFYQYIRAAAFSEKQERHVSVFTTELFANYLHMKFLSAARCHQLPLADEYQRYRKCLCNSPAVFVTDVVLFSLARRTKCPSNDRPQTTKSGETESFILRHLDTSKLVELLQQSAVEHLSTCRELESRDFGSVITADFKALYAYKCGQYRRCLQLSVRNVCRLMVDRFHPYLVSLVLPELIQLMDDEIVSLVGLAALMNRSPCSKVNHLLVVIHQLTLSLYLVTKCQIKLRHSVTSLVTSLSDVI